jgi:hypothetical protein
MTPPAEAAHQAPAQDAVEDAAASRPTPSTLLALGGWEAARLLRHPLVLLAAAGSYVFALNHVNNGSAGNIYEGITSVQSLILGPAAFFAANRAASRDRRADTAEMVTTAPTGPRRRTIAVLLAAAGPAVLTAAVIAALAMTYRGVGITPPRWPAWPELAVQPVTVLGGGLLGVLTARWVPHAGGAAIVMLALYWGEALIGRGPGTETIQVLAPFSELQLNDTRGHMVGWFPGSVPWHLAYLLCLDAMAAIGAVLATPGPRRALLAAGCAAVAGAALTGWAQLP